jgi:hypothetical protein
VRRASPLWLLPFVFVFVFFARPEQQPNGDARRTPKKKTTAKGKAAMLAALQMSPRLVPQK